MLLGVGSIFSLFIFSISSQSTPTNSRQCFPLNSRRAPSCPPGYGPQFISPQPPPPPNILEKRLFIRKLRNPALNTDTVLCCRVRNEEQDAEKLTPQSQRPRNPRKRTRRPAPLRSEEQKQIPQPRRRRRRKKPKSRLHAVINKLGDSVREVLNTSLTYTQYDGWTWTFRPFKVFSPFGEEQVFEKYRTRRGRNFRRNNLYSGSSLLRERPTSTTTTLRPNSEDTEIVEDEREFPPQLESPRPPPLQRPLPPSAPLIEASPRSPLPSLSNSSPYLLSIRKNGVHFCSGVVLDSTHILTAANCFVSPVPGTESQEMIVNIDPDEVTVKVGSAGDGTESIFTLEHICVHNTVPNPSKELNEAAVLTLKKALVFSADFFPARLLWEEKGDLLNGKNNYARWFSPSDQPESAPIKQVATRVCNKRHRFFMRKDEFCLQLGGWKGKPCSKSDFLGGVLECRTGPEGRAQVCGVITETSCPPLQLGVEQGKGRQWKNPVTKVSPIPKWIYPILTSNSYRSCF